MDRRAVDHRPSGPQPGLVVPAEPRVVARPANDRSSIRRTGSSQDRLAPSGRLTLHAVRTPPEAHPVGEGSVREVVRRQLRVAHPPSRVSSGVRLRQERSWSRPLTTLRIFLIIPPEWWLTTLRT